MKNVNDDDDDDNDETEDEYIFINSDKKIYICVKCDRYIIHIKGNFSTNNNNSNIYCPLCHYPFLCNVFASEAKIYFNPSRSDKTTRFIGGDYSTIGIRHYSKKIVRSIDVYA